MELSLRDRFIGTLMGVHAGDSLGAPYEKKSPEEIEADLKERGGLRPFRYPDPWNKDGIFPAGRPTDDSELTAALAQSLVERNGNDPEHQFQLFKRAVVGGESFLWDGEAKGFGGTTKKVLAPDTFEESQAVAATLSHMGSNGSLMRSAPLALFFHGRPRTELISAAGESSRVTHMNPVAMDCCKVLVSMLSATLLGATRKEVWFFAQCGDLVAPEVIDFVSRREPAMVRATNEWPPAGGALHTLKIAAYEAMYAKNFREGITSAVMKAGDTDTAAAVTGALLGARFGISGIPGLWINALKGRDRMTELANALIEKRK